MNMRIARNPAKIWPHATAHLARLGRLALLILPALLLVAGCGSAPSAQPESSIITPGPIRPAASRVKLGPISYSHAQISRIQNRAVAGEAPYMQYVNPVWAISHLLPQRGIDQPFQIYPPLRVRVHDRGLRYDVLLSQPLRSGSSGVWVISAILAYPAAAKQVGHDPGKPIRVIPVAHAPSELQRIQDGADRGVPQFVVYRNPLKVIGHTLRHFGLGTRFTIEPRLAVIVLKGLESYEVEVTQPALKGPEGIWLTSNIEPHIGGDDQG